MEKTKKAYIKPVLESETFVPQEYVSKCEYEYSYKGKCDISGYVFTDNNGNGIYDEKTDSYKYENTACNGYFESDVKPHVNAFIFTDRKWVKTGLWEGYYVGRGTMTPIYNFKDTHANANIDETVRHNVS